MISSITRLIVGVDVFVVAFWQVENSIPWVRCASGNVLKVLSLALSHDLGLPCCHYHLVLIWSLVSA